MNVVINSPFYGISPKSHCTHRMHFILLLFFLPFSHSHADSFKLVLTSLLDTLQMPNKWHMHQYRYKDVKFSATSIWPVFIIADLLKQDKYFFGVYTYSIYSFVIIRLRALECSRSLKWLQSCRISLTNFLCDLCFIILGILTSSINTRMRLIILDDADIVGEWAAKYVLKRIRDFNPGPNKYYT